MKKVIYILIVIFISYNLTAENYSTSAGRFLLLGGGAYAGAVGGAYCAVGKNGDTIIWNPAGLGTIKAFEVSFMHMKYGEDISYEYASSTIPLEFGTFGINFIYMGLSPFSEMAAGDTTGFSLDYSDMAISFGFGKSFLKNTLSFGIVAKYIKSSFGIKDTDNYFSASGYALDAGFLFSTDLFRFYSNLEKNLKIGVSVKNIGSGLTYISTSHKLPLNIKMGIFYKPIKYAQIMVEYNIINDSPSTINTGIEILPEWILSPRGGLKIKNNSLIYTAGLGFKYGIGSFIFALDYAFNQETYFNTHMVQVSLRKFSASVANFGISELIIKDIFPSMYKYYTKHPVGEIEIKNNTNIPIEKIKVSMFVNRYMDFPTESETIPILAPGDSIKVNLSANFNNEILKITEATPMQAQIKIKYIAEGKKLQLTQSKSFKLYNRYAMTWDNFDKLAAFVTPKDPPVRIFARGMLQKFRNLDMGDIPTSLKKAAIIFNAVGSIGLTYVLDPQSPYRQKGDTIELVDQIQYPRDTLRFKTGDCDDCASLFCALLESVGINTAFVDVQAHIFMAFDSEVPEENALQTFGKRELYIIKDGTAWIPVETTLYLKGFSDAWISAANTYRDANAKGIATIIDVKKAWRNFYPVTLPETKWEPELPDIVSVNKFLQKDKKRFTTLGSKTVIKKLKSQLQKDPQNTDLINKIGITYGKFGDIDNAEKYFKKAIKLDSTNPTYYNNLANIFFLGNKLNLALKNYLKAIKLDPNNPNYRINLSNLYSEMGDNKKSAEEMKKAEELLSAE